MSRKSVHMYPTLRCNGRCSYCSNLAPGMRQVHEYQERLPGHWIKLIRTLTDWELYFTGGEVFLFQGMKDILENVPEFAKVYTNGTLLGDLLLAKIDPKKVLFRCSYHPAIAPVERFVDGLKALEKREIPFQVFMVDTPEDRALENKILFREKGIEIGIDYDQKRHAHRKGRVRCSIPTMFVAPDGGVFHCVSRMVRNRGSKGNAFDGYRISGPEPVICDEPETCTPCDLAAARQESVE